MVARELQHAPRDPRGFSRGLPEPWVIPETGVRGWLTPTPSGRVSDRTALLLLCATDTEVLATLASWRSEQQWPGFASRRIWPNNPKKGKGRSGQKQLFFALGVTQRVNSWLARVFPNFQIFSQDLPALASLWPSAITTLRSQQIAARKFLTFQ